MHSYDLVLVSMQRSKYGEENRVLLAKASIYILVIAGISSIVQGRIKNCGIVVAII